MSVYYRIRNDAGLYYKGGWPGPDDWGGPFLAGMWLMAPRHALVIATKSDSTARIVKVTVTRKTKWPVEQAVRYLRDVARLLESTGFNPATWGQSEQEFRHILAAHCEHYGYMEICVAVAGVLRKQL